MSEMDNLQEADGLQENNNEVVENQTPITEEAVQEIENENAEDAEDNENAQRHEIETKDYHSLSMDALVVELEDLVKKHPIQAINNHVNQIKEEFNAKYNELLETKKEEFLAEGGNEIDFRYHSNTKTQFNKAYNEYRNKRTAYYKNIEESLKSNLNKRNAIIEEIKGLINVEENISSTYKHFKELQENWRNAGPIPRDRYNTVWNTYHHHVERFYDFLHLNRDLRDLDFKHNLELKEKIAVRAEELFQEQDVMKAFRELQLLHKTWKEDIGPVAQEHREAIWERFSNATKALHDKRQEHFNELDKRYEANLTIKNDIINKIKEVGSEVVKSHSEWQAKIKEIESLRTNFFNAGKVPLKVNEQTWANFKQAVRDFNKNKNAFYKNLKKDQLENLNKKMALIEIAEANQNNNDFQATTPLMKNIQSDWRKIGHVPKKDSDKIWKRFKAACNAYFDKLHAKRNEANEVELEALKAKEAYIEELKVVKLEGEHHDKLNTIKEHIAHWKSLGRVPRNKQSINEEFNKVVDSLFGQLDLDKSEAEKIKYQNKLAGIEGDNHALENELLFVKRKIDEIRSDINQLENNLAFFSNASEDNPLVKDVYKKIDLQKNNLQNWQQKIQQVKAMFAKEDKAEDTNQDNNE